MAALIKEFSRSQAWLGNAFTRQAQLGNHFRSQVQLGNEWKNIDKPCYGYKGVCRYHLGQADNPKLTTEHLY